MHILTIIGRPNVGKSTFFNRLVGKRKAIVDNTPGVTRDWKEEVTDIMGREIKLIDTAGLENAKGKEMQALMMKQTERAADLADILVLVVDATVGLTQDDKHFARWARTKNKAVILVANKCEKKTADVSEMFKLGFGEPIAISAEHNLGIVDFYDRVAELIPEEVAEENDDEFTDEEPAEFEDEPTPKEIQIAIIGRPNAGKSTLINRIVKDERVITSDVAGTTRDSIAVDWEYKGEKLKLIDTAGMRRKSNITGKIEGYSVKEALNAVRYAQIVILVVDATEALENQDLKIANHVIEEGRALILAVNKWDLVKDKKLFAEELDYLAARNMTDVAGLKIVKLSALKDDSVDKILDAALEAYQIWNMRVSTGKLNQWIEYILSHHPPPISKGRRIKIRYITQTKIRPPTFMLSCSQPQAMPESYLKYLINDLRKTFNMPGVPIRIVMPKKSNPFKNKKTQ